MLLTPSHILNKLGFKIPFHGLEISDEDERFYNLMFEIIGLSANNFEAIPDSEYSERFKAMAVYFKDEEHVKQATENGIKVDLVKGSIRAVYDVILTKKTGSGI
jgi:hypothetical protein